MIPDTLVHEGDWTAEQVPGYEGEHGFRPRLGSKLLIDATKGPPNRTAVLKDYFEPIFPMGYKQVKLEDFI